MVNQRAPDEKNRSIRFPLSLPLEYWETEGSSHGGLVGNLSESGILIYSIENIAVGTDLWIKVFISTGSGFDVFKAFSRVIWKGTVHEGGWNGYKYGLEFISLTPDDRLKFETLFLKRVGADIF
jgi:hypothetical protein